MLVPIYLGLCSVLDVDSSNRAAGALIYGSLHTAVLVSLVHSAAMIAAGGLFAWLVYRYLGLKFVARSWFNLDAGWALSLVLVGVLSLAFSPSAHLTRALYKNELRSPPLPERCDPIQYIPPPNWAATEPPCARITPRSGGRTDLRTYGCQQCGVWLTEAVDEPNDRRGRQC